MSRTNNSTGGSTPELASEVGLEAIPDAVLVADTRDGRIVTANTAAEELFHADRATLIGLQQKDLHPTEDAAEYVEAFQRGINGERVNRLQNGDPVLIEAFDGVRKPVEINVQRLTTSDGTFLLGVFREVSEQVERERHLKTTTSRLNTLLDALPVPVAVLDTNGTVVRWNPAAEATYGYTADQVVGEQYPLFIDDSEFKQLFDRVLTGEVLDGYETMHRTGGGSRISVELYVRPIYTDDGFSGMIGSAIDVSDRERRKKQLNVLYRVLRHNLRNELNVMMGWAQNLALACDGQQQAIEKINAAYNRLVTLSEDAAHIRAGLTSDTRQMSLVSLQEVQSELAQLSERDGLNISNVSIPDSASVPNQAAQAVFELLDEVYRNIGTHTAEVCICAHGTYVEIDVTTPVSVLPPGARLFIDTGEETALDHSSALTTVKASLMVESVGGNIILAGDETQPSTLRIELPRADD